MIDTPNIVIAPHVTTYVGNLGINEFANDLSRVMKYFASWDRHWRRLTQVQNFHRGDIMIFSYKSNKEWYVVGDGELLYDGLKENLSLFKPDAREYVTITSEDYMRLLALTVTP